MPITSPTLFMRDVLPLKRKLAKIAKIEKRNVEAQAKFMLEQAVINYIENTR